MSGNAFLVASNSSRSPHGRKDEACPSGKPEKDRPGRSNAPRVHAICHDYKTHKTTDVQAWLAKHPRFKLHFTPTSSSWIYLVDRSPMTTFQMYPEPDPASLATPL